jgi:PKD repeat protein
MWLRGMLGEGRLGKVHGLRIRNATPGAVTVRMRAGDVGAPVVERTLIVNAGPSVTFDFEPVSPLPGQEVLFASTINDPHGVGSQTWAFGDGGESSARNPRHTYGAPGTYTVSLTATDSLGATRTDTPRTARLTPRTRRPYAQAACESS